MKQLEISIQQNLESLLFKAETCANMADRQFYEKEYLNHLHKYERNDFDMKKFYDDFGKYVVRVNERRRK